MAKPYLVTLTQSLGCHVCNMLVLVMVSVFVLEKTLLVSATASAGSTVQYLPGFQGPLPFHLETGYVGVGESEDVQLFYYFVKSQSNPEKDPLLIWLTGGPGCSSWSGFVYEIGPLWYKIEQYNGTLPTLFLNQHSWTKISSILFIDSPVGAGFSYAKTPSASETGDLKQVQYLFQFFKKWLIDIHPEFISNPVYIAGDSYSGIIVPTLAQEISNGIEEGIIPPINLQGYILGNPVTDASSDGNSKIPFAHGMALISDELYESLEKNCGGEYYERIDPSNTECLKYFQDYMKCISGIRAAQILEADCPSDSPRPKDVVSGRRWLYQNSQVHDRIYSESPLPPFGCRETTREWRRCNYYIPYYSDIPSSFPYHVNLSAKGFRSLVYSGDHDMVVPYLGTQAWIRSLNYSIVDEWRSWVVQGQVAGYTRTYSNRMTFATVKGGGHTAVQYKPEECFAMFRRWINYESL